MARIEVIAPKKLFGDPQRIINVCERWLDMEAENVMNDFNATTQTWKKRPQFKIRKKKGERLIYTTDKVWKFVGITGTRIRYAVMSNDFRPKTRHGHLGSNKGKGGAVVMNFKNPRPGIKSREYDVAVKKKVEKYMQERVQRAINVEVSKMMK